MHRGCLLSLWTGISRTVPGRAQPGSTWGGEDTPGSTQHIDRLAGMLGW